MIRLTEWPYVSRASRRRPSVLHPPRLLRRRHARARAGPRAPHGLSGREHRWRTLLPQPRLHTGDRAALLRRAGTALGHQPGLADGSPVRPGHRRGQLHHRRLRHGCRGPLGSAELSPHRARGAALPHRLAPARHRGGHLCGPRRDLGRQGASRPRAPQRILSSRALHRRVRHLERPALRCGHLLLRDLRHRRPWCGDPRPVHPRGPQPGARARHDGAARRACLAGLPLHAGGERRRSALLLEQARGSTARGPQPLRHG